MPITSNPYGRRQVLRAGVAGALGFGALAVTGSLAGIASASPFDAQLRVDAASRVAADQGAFAGVAVLDRLTGQIVTGPGGNQSRQSMSVVKTFVADELLTREARGEITVSDSERELMVSALHVSSNAATDTLWAKLGGNSVVENVIGRYGLTQTAPPGGPWWTTLISAHDMCKYFDGLITGRGQTPPSARDELISVMRGTPPSGGAPSPFGLSAELPGTPVKALKHGWAPIDGGWILNSTGILGADNRFVAAILTSTPTDEFATAVELINSVTRALFPTGSAQ